MFYIKISSKINKCNRIINTLSITEHFSNFDQKDTFQLNFVKIVIGWQGKKIALHIMCN